MEQKNGQVSKRNIDVLKSILNADSVIEQFRNALKENAGAFVASIIDLYNSDKGLQKCEPKAVVMEALKAAVMKLPINKALGFAYIIVFNNSVRKADGSYEKVPTPTFVPGYKGYNQLAMRTGQYRTINADIVYEGEVKKKNKLTGEISFDGEKTSDKVTGYFAYFELLNGFSKTLYVELEDMAKHAKRFSPSIKFDKNVTVASLMKRAGRDSTGLGWDGDFDAMALKTCLRNLLSKYGYLSVDMQNAIAADIEADSMQNGDRLVEDTEAEVVDLTDEPMKPTEKKEPAEQNEPY